MFGIARVDLSFHVERGVYPASDIAVSFEKILGQFSWYYTSRSLMDYELHSQSFQADEAINK